jgi:hypothetical protein
MIEETPKKHPCGDCDFCQWCSDDRCRLCLKGKNCCRRKLTISEQVAAYDELNKKNTPTNLS